MDEPEFDCDYLICDTENEYELPNAPMLCVIPGKRIRATDGQVLAHTMRPYFSRTGAHFCGHRNTPHNKDSEALPAIVRKGNVLYMAHSIADLYGKEGNLYHKRFFMLALMQVFSGGPVTFKGLGSEGRATMIHQPEQNRYCVNMTYASPCKRGEAYIIEDLLPVYNVEVALDVPQTIKKAVRDLISISKKIAKEEAAFEKDPESMSKKELEKLIAKVEKQMRKAAADLDFETAAVLRDQMVELKKNLLEITGGK